MIPEYIEVTTTGEFVDGRDWTYTSRLDSARLVSCDQVSSTFYHLKIKEDNNEGKVQIIRFPDVGDLFAFDIYEMRIWTVICAVVYDRDDVPTKCYLYIENHPRLSYAISFIRP